MSFDMLFTAAAVLLVQNRLPFWCRPALTLYIGRRTLAQPVCNRSPRRNKIHDNDCDLRTEQLLCSLRQVGCTEMPPYASHGLLAVDCRPGQGMAAGS